MKSEEIAGRRVPQAQPSLRDPGLALCLSGGGYRAMLFHAGALRRLNDLGLLSMLSRVSSVSGGSIAAAALAAGWSDLDFDAEGVAHRFDRVERSLFDLAGRTLDVPAIVAGIVPGRTAASSLAVSYRRHLLGGVTLQELPDAPRFTFNTTNMMSGRLMRWSKPYVADYTVGAVFSPEIPLASVVAASSAFPPFASPFVLRSFGPFVDFDTRQPVPDPIKRLVLTDGGVYDNLGLQPVESFHTVLVSDGGAPSVYGRWLFKDWLTQSVRTLRIIDSQVRSLRRRNLVEDFLNGRRLGALWTISAGLSEYPVVDSMPVAMQMTAELADVPTRLKRMEPGLRKRLINWGYAAADAAIRSYVEPSFPAPAAWPFPEEPLG
jgi:NTE family protein